VSLRVFPDTVRQESGRCEKQAQLTYHFEIATLLSVARNDRMVTMGFLKNLFGGAPAKTEGRYYTIQVNCRRCGEIIEGRVDLHNDLSLNDEGNGYLLRKTLMGSNRCFQQIEVELNFDSARQLLEKTITGGTFVD
jgi:hypothetical protein